MEYPVHGRRNDSKNIEFEKASESSAFAGEPLPSEVFLPQIVPHKGKPVKNRFERETITTPAKEMEDPLNRVTPGNLPKGKRDSYRN